jgi:hypothetical protein
MRSRVAVIHLLLLLAIPLPAQAQELVIERWLINGPIPAPADSSRVIRDYLGGEASAMPTVGDHGWREIATDAFGRVDLNDVFAGSSAAWSAAYAHAYVFSPEDRTVLLVGDSDDDLTVHVNGQRVWLNVVARGLGRGNDTITVRLAEGWNDDWLRPRAAAL